MSKSTGSSKGSSRGQGKGKRSNSSQKGGQSKKGGLIFLFLLLCAIGVGYVAVAEYFTTHFLFNTYVNGTEAYKLTAGEVEQKILSGLDDYTLTITGRNNVTDQITSKDIQLTYQLNGQVEKAMQEQEPFLWPMYLLKETRLTTENVVEYSNEALATKVASLSLFAPENVEEPKDAYLPEESGDDGFEVVPEEQGCSPIKDKVVERIAGAIDVLEPNVTIDDDCYKKPNITADSSKLTDLRDSLNTYCKAVITYTFGDDTVVLDGTTIKEWCEVDGTHVELNEEKVKEFVNGLAQKYDTFGMKRTLVTHSGEELTIAKGDYGWWMNRDAETEGLIEDIKTGEKVQRTPVYYGVGAVYGEQDWGNSYVEIDLTSQHLWVYKDGVEVVDSDFVSGCVNKGNATPTGVYGITYKQRDATLKGANYSSKVKYWMPFNKNVGMHDASWRSEFGGWIYIIDGSHGCINLPTDKAAVIFNTVEQSEAVFVYGGKTTPEAVVTQEIVNPETGEVKVVRMPASAAEAMAQAAADPNAGNGADAVTQ